MDPSPTPSQHFDDQLVRTVERVRGLALTRLEAPFAVPIEGLAETPPTRAQAVREVAQRLADATASLETTASRRLPVIGAHALGDQLAVCGHDLLAAAGATHHDVLEAHAELLLALRRSL